MSTENFMRAQKHPSYFKGQSKINNLNTGWWQKDISPGLSFMILSIVLLSVFSMGAYFMKEYIKAWSIVSERAKIEGGYETEIDKLLLP